MNLTLAAAGVNPALAVGRRFSMHEDGSARQWRAVIVPANKVSFDLWSKYVDICQLICDDHHEQRRRFAILDEIDRADKDALILAWERLATFLEVHAAAEEKHFYPALLKVGEGAGSKDSPAAETRDAIGDHNEIRDAVSKVALHDAGSDDWYAAIAATRKANSDHMGEEERESLADFRRHASLDQRHRLAVAFAAFEAQHYKGVKAKDRDVEHYIREHE